jgi:enoyl-CoA hydratase/carnithine racemase
MSGADAMSGAEPTSGAEAVRYSAAGGVATLTMDQPHNRNALTAALLNGLADGLDSAMADRSVRAIVLTHTGPAFCAGADLSASRGTAEAPRLGLADVLARIQDAPKPVLARIAGHCVGGGVGLAAACDISIAADTARFGFTEVRLGVAPAIISVVCLPKLRRADALELFLSGERITAARAAEAGLITRAAPADELDTDAEAMVARLLAGGPSALAAAKQLVYQVPGMERSAAFTRTTELSMSLFASAEAAEGMAAFREKRPPAWAPPR